MMIETLESRQLLSTTYPINFTVSTTNVNLTGSGTITLNQGSITVSGSLVGTAFGHTINLMGTETFTR